MKITKALAPYIPFTIIRDSKEQKGTGWTFRAGEICAGTEVAALETGDYTIKGLEHVLRIERKGSVDDLVSSLSTNRMRSQMARLAKFKYAYVVVECGMEELDRWHLGAAKKRGRGIKVGFPRPDAAMSALMTLHFRYPSVHIVFAGKSGPAFVRSLCKRVLESHAKANA